MKLKIVGALALAMAFAAGGAGAQETFPDKPPKPGANVIKARGIKVEG